MESDEELLKYVNEMSGENYASFGDVPFRTLLLIHICLLWYVIDSYPVWPTLTSESIECKERKDAN